MRRVVLACTHTSAYVSNNHVGWKLTASGHPCLCRKRRRRKENPGAWRADRRRQTPKQSAKLHGAADWPHMEDPLPDSALSCTQSMTSTGRLSYNLYWLDLDGFSGSVQIESSGLGVSFDALTDMCFNREICGKLWLWPSSRALNRWQVPVGSATICINSIWTDPSKSSHQV